MKHIRWFLAVVVLSIFAGMVSAASVVSVEPSYLNVLQGDIFTVNITVDPADDEVMGAQYELLFNNTLLNATEQNKGTFLSQDGVGTSVYKNEINNTIGIVKYGEARSGVDYGMTNPSILATITFMAVEAGMGSLNLSKAKLSDPASGSISTEVKNGYVVSHTTDVNNDEDINGELPTTTTAPTQAMQTPAVNQTLNQTPLQSPTASITSTAVQTPTADQIPTEPTFTTPAGTVCTPARNNMVPGFATSFTIALMFAAFIIMRRR